MQSDQLIQHLCDAATRLTTWSFDRLASLAAESWVQEVGSPAGVQSGAYCQIEAELLDRFTESGIDVLHVPVTASDGGRAFGTDIFVYRDGRVRWDRKVFEFINGVPRPVE